MLVNEPILKMTVLCIFQKASKRKDDIAEAQMNVDDSPIRLITVLSDSERDVIIVITEEVSDTS